jgi:hypothetical protein
MKFPRIGCTQNMHAEIYEKISANQNWPKFHEKIKQRYHTPPPGKIF